VERFLQSIKTVCLDHFLVSEYVDYYHSERPHQGVDNQLLLVQIAKPKPAKTQTLPTLRDIHCHTCLGGLLKSYHRKAA
jgi:putative transposase